MVALLCQETFHGQVSFWSWDVMSGVVLCCQPNVPHFYFQFVTGVFSLCSVSNEDLIPCLSLSFRFSIQPTTSVRLYCRRINESCSQHALPSAEHFKRQDVCIQWLRQRHERNVWLRYTAVLGASYSSLLFVSTG